VIALLLLLAPDPSATKVPQVEKHIEAGEKAAALALLKEIAGLEKNHAEARALVKLIRDPRLDLTDDVREACFVALEGIKSRKVTRDLKALLKHSRLKKDPLVRAGVCRALSGSADPAGVETLVRLLRDKNDQVIAAAAEAAGSYRYARESIRKELFNRLMNIYVSTWNLKNSVNPDMKTEKRRAERKWEVVEKPMEKSMQLLSNVTQNDPPAWRRWWNKNKHKRWDDLEN